MNEKFEKCISFVLEKEGGYVNNPNDPGGETRWGISKRSYPKVDIKNLTIDQAKGIYLVDYWTPLGCGGYDDKLARAILDAGVNCGVGTVLKWIAELRNEITVEKFCLKRLRRYANLCQKNPKLKEFLLSWLIRTLQIYEREI